MDLSKQELESLEQAQALVDMSQASGWSKILRPWLEAKLNQAFPDPAHFKSVEEFTYASLAASALKKSIAEILNYVADQPAIMKALNDKKQGKTNKSFSIGG